VPRGGRRRREGTRWFVDIHAAPQAYHAGPDAVIHPSAWKGEFSEVDDSKLSRSAPARHVYGRGRAYF
jgi:hypothetical protein